MSHRTVYYVAHRDGRPARVVMEDSGALAVEFFDAVDRARVLETHAVIPTERGGEEDLLGLLVDLDLTDRTAVGLLRRAWHRGTDPRALPADVEDLWWLVVSLHAEADRSSR